MPLDTSSAAFLSEMARAGFKPIHESSPEEVRALGPALVEMYGVGPEMARVENHTVTTTDGAFGVRVLVPRGTPRAVIIYYHGGGWVIGAIEEFDALGRRLAERTECAVVLVDYRLAPEYRYPTAADDAYAALHWTADRVPGIAGAQVPLIVAGDSAGGNLAAVTALRARDRKGPAIAMQVLIYPVTDSDVNTASYTSSENQLMLNRDSMIWFWDHYAPDPATRAHPDASPLRADSLAGLPPAVVLTAEYDPLRDEGEAYAARLEEAGIPVELKRHAGQMHGFFTLLMLPGSTEALDQVVAAIKAHLAAKPA